MAMATLTSRSRRSNGTVESRTSTASGAVTVTAQSRVEDHGVVVTPVDGDRPFGHPCDTPQRELRSTHCEPTRSLVHTVGDESLLFDDCSGNSVLGNQRRTK